MKQILQRLSATKLSVLSILAVFAILLPIAWAASSNVIIEAEQGTRTGQTSLASSSTASGGSYVSFSAATGGAQFQTSFDTMSDFTNNFDYSYGGAFYPPGDPNRTETWLGDHDTNCGGDGTYRTIQFGQTRADAGSSFYVCPLAGDPHGGHLMMSYYSVGMNGLWMSPKPFFNDVKKLCWDMSLTYLGGRDFFDVVIATKADIDANTARNGYYDLAFSPPGYQDISGNQSTTGVVMTTASKGFGYFHGWFSMWTAGGSIPGQIDGPLDSEDLSMHQICVVDNGNGTTTLSLARPDGIRTATAQGSFPTGQVRVIFEYLVHNAPKAEDYDPHQNTVHLDNILIQ